MDKTSSQTSLDKKEPPKIYTRAKFIYSKERNKMEAYVASEPDTGRIVGVKFDAPVYKRLCIPSLDVTNIVANVLYDVTLVPMSSSNGFIVTEATPVQFEATVKTYYTPKIQYVASVSFGYKEIFYDPLYGKQRSTRTIDGIKELLERRIDIKNITSVIEDFTKAAMEIRRKFIEDGMHRRTMQNFSTVHKNRKRRRIR